MPKSGRRTIARGILAGSCLGSRREHRRGLSREGVAATGLQVAQVVEISPRGGTTAVRLTDVVLGARDQSGTVPYSSMRHPSPCQNRTSGQLHGACAAWTLHCRCRYAHAVLGATRRVSSAFLPFSRWRLDWRITGVGDERTKPLAAFVRLPLLGSLCCCALVYQPPTMGFETRSTRLHLRPSWPLVSLSSSL